jgi:tetratricopeptide (TPR) repeat protein
VHFLVQALNLDGRYRDSIEQVRHMMSFKESPRERTGDNQRTPYRQGYFSLVKTLVRFEKWEAILDPATLPVYDRPEQKAWRHWSRGLAYASTGREAQAREELASMEVALNEVKASKDPLLIAAQELEGHVEARFGDRRKGFDLMRRAADREAALIYTEPPSYPRPAVEGLASVALALGDTTTAERAYREALDREPGSGRAYFGLAAAYTAAGRAADAREVTAKGLRAWDKADEDLPQVRLAKAGTAAAR